MKPRVKVDVGSRLETPELIPSGSTLLDCVLGGGYPLGRVVNVVGDKSTGKTLLAIEAAVNFLRSYPAGRVFYNETESAFDRYYAASIGLPVDDIAFVSGCDTVEGLYDSLSDVAKSSHNQPTLYILDSLDALSDRAELARDMKDNTYGQTKAKKLSEMFRRLVRVVDDTKICLYIVSQVRANVGSIWGEQTVRTGGKALDFYASQVVHLYLLKRLTRERKKITRAYGVRVRARCTKNKIGLPFRDCDFDILFGYGVNDFSSCLQWLDLVGEMGRVGAEADAKQMVKRQFQPNFDCKGWMSRIIPAVREVWSEVDRDCMPATHKYL